MAKTLSPLFSSSAHGKLARSLVYSKKKSGQLARAMHYPKKEPSLKQWTRRHIVGLLTAHWQCMTDNERSTWNTNAAASNLNLPGYQYFLKLAQADLYTHHGMVIYLPLNEATGENCFCAVCDMFMGVLKPSYPDNCPIRSPSFRKEYGNSLFFDGTDDYVQISYHSRFSITEAITLEAWIKLSSLSHGWQILFANSAAAPNRVMILRVINQKLYFYASSDGLVYVNVSTDSILTLDWTYVVATFSTLDNKMRLYINSVQWPDTQDLDSLHVAPKPLFFGGTPASEFFFGGIDEFRVYNRALGAEEIKKHFALLRLDKKRQPLLRL